MFVGLQEDFNYDYFDLVYIDENGNNVHMNQKEILDALTVHKDKLRDVPTEIDSADQSSIDSLSESIR